MAGDAGAASFEAPAAAPPNMPFNFEVGDGDAPPAAWRADFARAPMPTSRPAARNAANLLFFWDTATSSSSSFSGGGESVRS